MTLQIQKFLRENGLNIELLVEKYGIKAKRHGTYSNLVLFKYDQIASPFSERIVQECRGIILDESADWCVRARGFDKFFNHGEGHAASIDWSNSPRVQEKVDGSFCVLYGYDNKWHVSTTGTPDASGNVNNFGTTFADYFWSTFGDNKEALPSPDCGKCFFFELTGPLNRVVVPHAVASLTVLGGRSNLEGLDPEMNSQLSATEAGSYFPKIKVVAEHSLASFEDIVKSFDYISGLSQEGYVVVDGHYNRVKIKHPQYIALHHAKDGMGFKSFVDISRRGETSEFVNAFPEFAEMFALAKSKVDALAIEIESRYQAIAYIPEQKSFAMEACKDKYSSALFAVRAKKADSVKSFLKDVRLETLMGWIGEPQ